MGRRVAVVVLGIALVSAPMVASAASPWTSGVTYSEKATGKLKYGLTNAILGWTSLFREPMQASQDGDNVLVGIGRGIWNAAGQTVGGALHAVTFLATPIDIPLPEGGTDILGS